MIVLRCEPTTSTPFSTAIVAFDASTPSSNDWPTNVRSLVKTHAIGIVDSICSPFSVAWAWTIIVAICGASTSCARA